MCVMETDACPKGMAFWCPAIKKGFALSTPPGTPPNQIIFYEALAVLSALHNAHLTLPSQRRIVIFTDNLTIVAMFNSLQAIPDNCILNVAIDILLEGDHDLEVLHILGKSNLVADALSCLEFVKALSI